ncbi:hypothetical protein [Pelobacter propionicus]|uniref:hypothetical protein n=1 Tax=Pelobacter propionicus TaxID=29543 RepID=UPI0012EDB88D|nr:hypothetical protein [Pelobacter propionicus]
MMVLKIWWSIRSFWISIFILLLFSLWLGLPTYRKWKVDRLVDELCTKDGGSKVYETVILPVEKFDGLGLVYVPPQSDVKPTDEYYETNKITWIIPESNKFGSLDLFRSHTKIYRIADGKLISEHVSYARRGGDPILIPVHPSSYSCKDKSQYYKQPFIKHDRVKNEPTK